MQKKLVLFVSVAALISLAASRVEADDPARQLEGAWSLTAVTMNGVKSTERIANRFKVMVQGTKMILKPGLSVNGDGKIEAGAEDGDEATFTLDAAKSPAHIDLTFGSGMNKMLVKGIYVVEKGELKICYSPKSRPADFANAADSGQTLLVGKRDKP